MDAIQFYKSLADETRLMSLLLILQEEELCVCELMEALEDIQPKISRHLAQLKKNGLLVDRRQGQWVFYRLNPSLPIWCLQVLKETQLANIVLTKQQLKRIQCMGSRPERLAACC
ncbi:MAG: metalloregulator ArsR/SmtB family transcription factor [Cellvibrionaceae bacterium]